MTKKDIAVEKFMNGYNCAQAVVCTYAGECDIEEETAFRLAEGFGSGIPGLGNVCGACSGMVMVTSLKCCLKMDSNKPTKKVTYPQVKQNINKFIEKMGYAECNMLLKTKDKTLVNGVFKGCIECVKCACEILEEDI